MPILKGSYTCYNEDPPNSVEVTCPTHKITWIRDIDPDMATARQDPRFDAIFSAPR